jgi:hypothetical protein
LFGNICSDVIPLFGILNSNFDGYILEMYFLRSVYAFERLDLFENVTDYIKSAEENCRGEDISTTFKWAGMLCLKYTNIPDPPPHLQPSCPEGGWTPTGLRIYGNECSYSVDHQRHTD